MYFKTIKIGGRENQRFIATSDVSYKEVIAIDGDYSDFTAIVNMSLYL